MEDQVAKAKARKKPVKDAVIQAIEPAAIDEVVKLDDTIDTVQPGQEEPARPPSSTPAATSSASLTCWRART